MFALLSRKGSTERKSMNNSGSGKARKILSKLSGAFMLPISVMAIGGMLLGIGATIDSNLPKDAVGLKTFAQFIQQLGNPIFAVLPLLFAIAFVIAFTDEAGVAVFATVVGYVTFLAIQSIFITPEGQGFKVLFGGAGRNPEDIARIVGDNSGYRSLQTSVFGGIIVGLIMQALYNRFHTIQLPTAISFFGGKRFVAIVAIPVMALLAIAFLIIWPYIGYGLNKFGTALQYVKYGDSFVFGYIERALIPFGLHHVFYAPLWYTAAGGNVAESLDKFTGTDQYVMGAPDIPGTLAHFKKFLDPNSESGPKIVFTGDSTISVGLLRYPSSYIYLLKAANPQEVDSKVNYINQAGVTAVPLFVFVSDYLGIRVGRFLDGKFSIMMFGLVAAAIAMILAAPKENRKVTLGTVVPAAATSFMTGVTEPIEFTFLFLSPLLFWGFHSIMAAFSFLFANLAGTHIPMVFSGGVLDMIVYGVVNVQKGTHFWWPLVIGVPYFGIYLVVFYYWIKIKDLATPGRGGNVKLFTKSDFLKTKDSKNAMKSTTGAVDPQALAIVEAYGGLDNITAFNNCASRLRYDVKDGNLVDDDKLKAAGAFGVKHEGNNHVQAIFGPAAEQLNTKIKAQREAIRAYMGEHSTVTQSDELRAVNRAMSEPKTMTNTLVNPVVLHTPARGKIMDLSELKDGTFSEKVMGDGFAVKFDSEAVGNVYSPMDGEIKMVFGTKHAYGISNEHGVDLLVHIGIDTVKLDGKGFTSMVEKGQKVKAGDLIAKVDLNVLKEHKLPSDVIVVILNESKHKDFVMTNSSMKADTKDAVVGEIS